MKYLRKFKYWIYYHIGNWLWRIMDLDDALASVKDELRNEIPDTSIYAYCDDLNNLEIRVDNLEREI